jgi:hypothetical protein
VQGHRFAAALLLVVGLLAGLQVHGDQPEVAAARLVLPARGHRHAVEDRQPSNVRAAAAAAPRRTAGRRRAGRRRSRCAARSCRRPSRRWCRGTPATTGRRRRPPASAAPSSLISCTASTQTPSSDLAADRCVVGVVRCGRLLRKLPSAPRNSRFQVPMRNVVRRWASSSSARLLGQQQTGERQRGSSESRFMRTPSGGSFGPRADRAHQVLQEVDVVDRQQDAGQHLVGDGEMAQVGA